MELKTLDELKAENAAAEAEQQENTAKPVEEVEAEAVEEEVVDAEELAEAESEEATETETEAWMQSEEQGSQDGEKLFTGSDVAAAKRKLKAKLADSNDELTKLREENERLKSGSAKPAQNTERPRRDSFLDHDDPDEAFAEALVDWKISSQQAVQQQTQQTQLQQQALEKAVDSHYEEAGKLITEHSINPEVYQASDRTFREAIEQVKPGYGDLIADAMIANLGEGSAKAVFFTGRNKQKLAEFQQALLADPTGIKAAMVLGKISKEANMPTKIAGRAPKPATQVNGDSAGSISGQAKKLLNDYQKAHSKGGGQAAYNIKKQAKAAGIDVSNW